MKTTHRSAALVLAAVAVLAAACGNSSEESLEQLIEQQSGEDVEIDFGDDGEISVESDEGSFTLDDEGNFTVVGEDGEVVTGNVDADGDSINIESDEGNVVIEGDGDSGSVEISGEDGDVSFQTGADIPAEWPSDVPQPTDLMVQSGSVITDENGTTVTVVGTVSGDIDMYVGEYGAMLEAAGLPQTGRFEVDGSVTLLHENAAWNVTVSGVPSDDGPNQMSVFVTPIVP